MSTFLTVLGGLMNIGRLAALVAICYLSYTVRLHAVNEYGRVIHEFDPYFNFRSTEYFVEHGWSAFFNWYDDRSWYPLGRPVGTTIYPGLQIVSAGIYYGLKLANIEMSLNDVCVFVPAWFASVSCLATFGIAYETTRSANAGVVAAFVMAILPSHIMRSVAGGYDNESIAMAAMCLTFYLWLRSIRSSSSWPVGFLTALAYVFMVAAWGGYVFVLNMIGVHAMFLLVLGRYTPHLHKAYTLFYALGTLGAIQVPIVGLAPIKSLEQLGPMFVFFVMQLAFVMDYRRKHVKESITSYRMFQLTLIGGVGVVLAGVVSYLIPLGYFGPLSSRVRGLFVKHTHTGNPLVDSVAEHQATRDEMYFQFFHNICYLAPLGFLSLLWNRNDAKGFVFVYAVIALYFSRKMNRLVLLLSPVASVLGGAAISGLIEWSLWQFWDLVVTVYSFGSPAKKIKAKSEEEETAAAVDAAAATEPAPVASNDDSSSTPATSPKKKKKNAAAVTTNAEDSSVTEQSKDAPKKSWTSSFTPLFETLNTTFNKIYIKLAIVRYIAAGTILFVLYGRMLTFWGHANSMAEMLSNPSIIMKAQTQDGRTVYLDDFREAYWWLRDHTPADSRVMSWWDYGYQIAQIANRTTLADGNTWNHEHIALLGKILVSPVKDSHKIVRHLADYVLVWSTRFVGNPGDDIAKSPHMARIGGSVYKDVNPDKFYIDRNGRPSRMMASSLVYNLVLNKFDPNVPALPKGTYSEAYTSPNRMVRIYKVLNISKESKKYCAENRGYQAWKAGTPLHEAYPPGLQSILSQKQDFAQLEDFNANKGKTEDKKEKKAAKKAKK